MDNIYVEVLGIKYNIKNMKNITEQNIKIIKNGRC